MKQKQTFKIYQIWCDNGMDYEDYDYSPMYSYASMNLATKKVKELEDGIKGTDCPYVYDIVEVEVEYE